MAVNLGTIIDKVTHVTTAWLQYINDTVNGLSDTSDVAKGDALIGVKRTATGASATTLHAWLEQQVLNVKADFAAAGNGVNDDTAAISAAVAALPNGGTLFFPPGTYLVSSAITANAPIRFLGAGADSTILRTTSATADILVFNDDFCSLQGIGFSASVTRTAGAYISITANGGNCSIRNFHMTGYFIGIYGTNSSTYWISEGLMYGPATNARGIQLTGTVPGGGNDIYINRVTMSAAANVTTAAGINLINTGAVNITDCDIIRHGKCLLINPDTNQFVAYVYVNNSYFDTATNGVNIETTGTGFAQGVRLVGSWTSAHTDSGIKIVAGSTLYGLELIGHHAFSNGVDGLTANSGTDIHLLGGGFCGHGSGSGVAIAAGVSFWSCVGVRSGNGFGKTGNLFGIFVGVGAGNVYRIVGCDLTGNITTNLSDGGTGTVKHVSANIGAASGATGTLAVGASPFTYTAGPLPELVYINGGTVSLVTANGVSVFQGSNVSVYVQPNSTCVVTYTVAPTMARTIINV